MNEEIAELLCLPPHTIKLYKPKKFIINIRNYYSDKYGFYSCPYCFCRIKLPSVQPIEGFTGTCSECENHFLFAPCARFYYFCERITTSNALLFKRE